MTDKINLDSDSNLSAEELEQVKGGPAYMKLGDIKGEATTSSSNIKTGYDLKAAKKV